MLLLFTFLPMVNYPRLISGPIDRKIRYCSRDKLIRHHVQGKNQQLLNPGITCAFDRDIYLTVFEIFGIRWIWAVMSTLAYISIPACKHAVYTSRLP